MCTSKRVFALFGLLSAIWLVGVLGSSGRAQGDALLTGRVAAASGEKMEGVTLSARQLGKPFTTSVFTDAEGEYYFPRLEPGKYKIWAQATGYEAAILEDVTLGQPVNRQDLVLKAMPNFEKQLRGDEWMASLPEDTPQDKKMKEVYRMTCTGGCHSPGHVFIHRFDERGWKIIVDVMSKQPRGSADLEQAARSHTSALDSGSEDANVMPLTHYWKNDLAAYLAKVRGPVPNALKLKPRPRPKGEETLAVFWSYDSPGSVPLFNDGSLWQLGPPSATDAKNKPLRATVDFDGNPWFAGGGSLRKIDWKTGKIYTAREQDSGAVGAPIRLEGGSEIFTDVEGAVWTRVWGPNAHLVRVDRTGKIDRIPLPDRNKLPSASRSAQNEKVSAKRQVRVWWEERNRPVTCSKGVCETPPTIFWMYEPSTRRWATYDNPPARKGMRAYNDVYNLTFGGDADGNGWWSQQGTDVLVKAWGNSPGEVTSVPLPNRKNPAWELFTGDDRKIFEMVGGSEPHSRGVPYQHSIRMVGAGPGPTDSVWGSGWYSSDLIRVHTRTHRVSVYGAPLPDCAPYHTVVDPLGKVWTTCSYGDYLRRFDPETERWTRYDLPILGVDSHGMGVAPVLIDGRVRVVVPGNSSGKIILMDVRTRDDVQALKAEVQRRNRAP